MAEQVTTNGNASSLANLSSTPDAGITRYILLKGESPINTEQKRQLASLGVTIFEYLGQDSYLCRYDPEDLQPIRDLSFVEYANIYHTYVKPSGSFTEALQASQRSSSYHIEIALHKGERDVDKILGRLGGLGILRDDASVNEDKVRPRTSDEELRRIAGIDEARSIEPVVEMTL
ncbi:hypothetical protein GGR51DRAFT_577678 [Nemania sp. FL0031]|nr:hypothetical protein GGR51DRAFT_577678 [Nemania sp. FL0031]